MKGTGAGSEIPPRRRRGGPYRYLDEIKTLLTDLLTIVGVTALIVGSWAWVMAFVTWLRMKDVHNWIVNHEKEPAPGLKKLTEIECELTEHNDSISALHTSLKKLRSRVGMRENRAQSKSNSPEIPDSKTDPAGYKTYMRHKLGKTRLG